MKAKSTTRGAWFFLLTVLLGYGIAFFVDPKSAGDAMERSVALLSSLLPTLGLVILLLFLSSLLLRPDWVRANLGEGAGPRGWILALIGGILSAGPVYAWYALLKDLKTKGMRTALMSVFLYARAIKLPLLPLMIHYFGLGYTLILATYLILFSLPAGLLLEWMVDERPRPIGGPPSTGASR